jgi:hypothetical protein
LKEEQVYIDKKVEIFGLINFFLSIAGLFVAALPFGILALILGLVSLNMFNQYTDKYTGKFLAVLGIIIGFIDIVAVLLYLSRATI